MSTSWTLLTFSDLVRLAEARRTSAQAVNRKTGWDRLLDVARGLAANEGNDAGVLSGHMWRLAEVRVESYQGVATMPTVRFAPEPGITVINGPNGSGKSSIADAVETALSGAPRPHRPGSGGNAALWERAHCLRGADRARVGVTLTDGPECLHLVTEVDAVGSVIERRSTHARNGVREELDLDHTPWASALAGQRPVFAYARLERQVQVARDLQEFLEPLLALGGCFEELAAAVSTAAADRWTESLVAARNAVREVDEAHRRDSTDALPDLAWPTIDLDPDRWPIESGLTESGIAVPVISEGVCARLRSAAEDVDAALDDLESTERTALSRLAGPLRALHQQALHADDLDERCPVCRNPAPEWTTTLRTTLDGLDDLDVCESVVGAALSTLRDRLNEELGALRTAFEQDWFEPDAATSGRATLTAHRELWVTLGREGTRSTTSVRRAARDVCARLRSEEWARVVSVAVAQSDHRRQWLWARRSAVDMFVDVWRVDGSVGQAAGQWIEAEKYCLKNLQGNVRRERSAGLGEMVGPAVRRLLQDVGLDLVEVSVQGTKATLDLIDRNEQRVDLAMLSTGQRNALLLAPLLAVPRNGPFGFVVLDDPVHAFDEVRVDLLARVIGELAATTQVVVLTHDERLTEHLGAQPGDIEIVGIDRDASTGAVRHDRAEPAWSALITSAREALARADDSSENTTVAPRTWCMGSAAWPSMWCSGRSSSIEATRLAGTSRVTWRSWRRRRRRRSSLRLRCSSTPTRAGDEGRRLMDRHALPWNQAAHGNPPATAATVDEINDARRLCRLLLGLTS